MVAAAAPAEAAVRLGVEETTAVIVRRRLFLVEDQPVVRQRLFRGAGALSPGLPVVRVLRTIDDVDATPLEVQEFRYEVDMR